MPAITNRLNDLLGVDTSDRQATNVGVGTSPLNPAYMALNGYNNGLFTHFNDGSTIPAGWTLSNTNGVAAATYGTLAGGVAVLTTDDVAAVGASISTGLHWQIDRQLPGQPLVFECRFKAGTLATAEYFFGLSDTVAHTNLIALSATSTFTTSTATDGVFLGTSATPTSGGAFTSGGNEHVMLSSIAGTDAVVAKGAGVFVTATYYTYRIEVTYAGVATAYVNGALIGTKTGLTTTVPLCAYATASPRTTSERVLTIDYIGIAGL
jgi:hypothetical protein